MQELAEYNSTDSKSKKFGREKNRSIIASNRSSGRAEKEGLLVEDLMKR